MIYDNRIWRWQMRICAALVMLLVLGCRGSETRPATGPAASRPGGDGFELRFETRSLPPHRGRRALCECDDAGRLRVAIGAQQDVTLQLGPEAVQSLAVAAEAYVRRPAPFAKLAWVDGSQIELCVRSGTTVRVSVIRNSRMPPEGRALMDAIRKAAAGAQPTDAQASTIDDATELLLGIDFPDEEDDVMSGIPPKVIANDAPARLVELLEKNRPRWLSESEAWFLREVLIGLVPAATQPTTRPDGL